MGKDFFTTYQTLCGDSFVLPPPCLRRRRRSKKRGISAGILCRSRTRHCNPPLPSNLLANVQSLDNKMDELHARMNFQRDIANCYVLVFTETWTDPTVPDSAVRETERGRGLPDGQLSMEFGCSSIINTLLTRPGAVNYKGTSLLPPPGIQLRYNLSSLHSTTGR